MSEVFKRSEVGHNANDLHKHGGLIAPEEEKTERENLEDAIEALNESEETEKLVKIEKDMKGEAKAPAEARPINEENSEAIDELLKESESTPAEPINAWKTKKEDQAYMNNEQAAPVAAPKEAKNSGMGWKIATVACLLLAIAGCGMSAYLMFNNGKVELMGRTITSASAEKKESTKAKEPETGELSTDPAIDGRYILLDLDGYALKVPETIDHLSFKYMRGADRTIHGVYTTLIVNAAKKLAVEPGADGLGVPEFISENEVLSLGAIISVLDTEDNNKPFVDSQLIFKTDDGRAIYYYGQPHVRISESPSAQEHEIESVAEIKKWLTNKNNYIKLK